MVVASAAFQREPQDCGAEGLDTVSSVFGHPLLGDRSAFVREAMEPVERRGENLIARRMLEQVARELVGRDQMRSGPDGAATSLLTNPVALGAGVILLTIILYIVV